jgi:hypothetical protein
VIAPIPSVVEPSNGDAVALLPAERITAIASILASGVVRLLLARTPQSAPVSPHVSSRKRSLIRVDSRARESVNVIAATAFTQPQGG